jgi:transcriptional regulator with XRE-family HTH domain
MHHVNIRVKHENSSDGFAISARLRHNDAMNIAGLRKRLGLTQTDLADMTKLTQPTISRAERGDDGTTMATLASIAAALQVPLGDLFLSDRSPTENELLQLFRRLPPDRQKGWIDMARLAEKDHP